MWNLDGRAGDRPKYPHYTGRGMRLLRALKRDKHPTLFLLYYINTKYD